MDEHSKRILIVDDEVAFAHTLKRHLKRYGFKPDLAGDGNEAVKQIEAANACHRNYVLVISDVVMPGMSGLALIQWIKAQHATIPVMLLTGYGANHNLRSALRPGTDLLVRKPVDPQQMLVFVRGMAAHREANSPRPPRGGPEVAPETASV